jgi:hypothetical protein
LARVRSPIWPLASGEQGGLGSPHDR